MHIYDTTLAAIASAPVDRPVAVIMRHSVRYPILDDESVYTAALTPEGIRLAEELGEKLVKMRPIRKIVTNFVGRCQQTADAIARGAGFTGNVARNLRISHPFIEPAWDALPIAWPEDAPPVQVRALLSLVTGGEHQPGVVDVYVTHDTIVGALAGYLMGEKFDSSNWPNYLEGVLLWRDGARLFAHWRGQTREFHGLLV
jgi:broad specificity phosphatase PhoE